MIAAFILGFFGAVLIGLTVDYLWRRARRSVAFVAGIGNAVAVIALVGVIAAGPVLRGPLEVAALVVGLSVGTAAANAAAGRVWGPAAHRW